MRLRRLDLTRYGRFTEHSLDFGEKGEGADLHIVYGPNEAGKSTILNAILDLLYGIPTQSPYAFMHSYQTMRVGAALEVGGTRRDVVRIKRPSGSLLDPANVPVPEGVISSALGGIGREAYRNMFSLDDESLESGGKAILESRGDLGEILFSATAGLAGLSRRLGEVKGRADEFYKYRAQGGRLVELKRRLIALRDERDAIDMGAARHAGLVAARDASRGRYEDTLKERAPVRTRLDAIAAALGALPRLAALRDLRARSAPLLDIPEPPPIWADELPELRNRTVALAAALDVVERAIERQTSLLDGLVPDAAALKGEHRLAQLAALHPRKETALEDLPARQHKLAEEDAAVAAALSRIGRAPNETPAAFLLPAAVTAALRDAVEAKSGVDAALAGARTALRDAEERWEEARARRDASAPRGEASRLAALGDLAAVLAAVRLSDHAIRAKSAARVVRECEPVLRAGLATLAPFAGSLSGLAAAPVPGPKVLAAWGEAAQRREAERRRFDEEQHRLEDEVAGLLAERDGLAAADDTLSDAAAAALRAERDRAWSEHRRALDARSADAFEAALARDDAAGVRRLREMTQRAQIRRVDAAVASARARLGTLQAARRRAHEAGEASRAEVERAWQAMTGAGATPAPDIAGLEAWILRRADVLKAAAALGEAQRDLDEAAADGAALAGRLRHASAAAGVDAGAADFDVLVQRAQATLDAEAADTALRTAVSEREADCGRRRAALAAAEGAAQDWANRWDEICASCWLGDGEARPGVPFVREVLDELGVLAAAWTRRGALADRIDKMQRDVSSYAAEARFVADLIGEPVAEASDAEIAKRVQARVAAAVATRDRRTALAAELGELRRRRDDLAREDGAIALRIGAMAAAFGVETAADVADALARVAARRQLRGEIEGVEREIVDALGSGSIGQAEDALRAADRDALELERSEARLRLDDLDRRCHELFAAWSAAADAVDAEGGDARAAELEERRRTTLLEIEDGAQRYLRLRAGVAAMEQALRLYRDRHRGPMMELASETFATISGGAYTGLRTQPHRDREVLIAVSADGGSKDANELSKGTRFQLYLALRAAGYIEGAWSDAPPPFVADDIMETFDDTRAEEALRLFARMTDVGQVIYLTHHRHLLPIARAVCPGVRVHALAGAGKVAA